jgi:hypothetical protein
MAEELDEFGIPIKRQKPQVDEFGIPLKKKRPSYISKLWDWLRAFPTP